MRPHKSATVNGLERFWTQAELPDHFRRAGIRQKHDLYIAPPYHGKEPSPLVERLHVQPDVVIASIAIIVKRAAVPPKLDLDETRQVTGINALNMDGAGGTFRHLLVDLLKAACDVLLQFLQPNGQRRLFLTQLVNDFVGGVTAAHPRRTTAVCHKHGQQDHACSALHS